MCWALLRPLLSTCSIVWIIFHPNFCLVQFETYWLEVDRVLCVFRRKRAYIYSYLLKNVISQICPGQWLFYMYEKVNPSIYTSLNQYGFVSSFYRPKMFLCYQKTHIIKWPKQYDLTYKLEEAVIYQSIYLFLTVLMMTPNNMFQEPTTSTTPDSSPIVLVDEGYHIYLSYQTTRKRRRRGNNVNEVDESEKCHPDFRIIQHEIIDQDASYSHDVQDQLNINQDDVKATLNYTSVWKEVSTSYQTVLLSY